MQLQTIISKHSDNIAFIVGNGINRYPDNPKAISWEELLIKLWERFSFKTMSQIPEGITDTEFFDLLDIESSNGSSTNTNIQKEAGKILESWSDKSHHKTFVEKVKSLNAPILTTNFDLILPTTLNLQQYNTEKKSFTDYYPWTTYFGEMQIDNPTNGFGIWYINGFVKYHRSIRLGLSHYMGSVERARRYLHKGKNRLFNGTSNANWKGHKSWLHIIFNKSLFIFGLGLDENEVFLRWLLIERAKYFRKFPALKRQGWYVLRKPNNPTDRDKGKKFFLESIGFEVIETEDYDSIYNAPWH